MMGTPWPIRFGRQDFWADLTARNHLVPHQLADMKARKAPSGFWIKVRATYRDTASKKTDYASACIFWNPLAYGFTPCITVPKVK